jgi:serine/threonine protein kinase
VADPIIGPTAIRLPRSETCVANDPQFTAGPDALFQQYLRRPRWWPTIGEVWFARYDVEKEIGRGGSSIVFRARDSRTGAAVALKVLRYELRTSVTEQRFVREIELMRSVSHAHIMPLRDYGFVGDTLFYVMPYVSDDTLRHYMSRCGRLSTTDTLRVLGEVGLAVDHLHRLGFVHRDIKPENVFMDDDRSILADFGSVVAIHPNPGPRLTTLGCCLGTPEYMSPEQFLETDRIGAASDIYSTACLAFELLSGETPYSGRNAQTVVARHVSAPIPKISDACGRTFRAADEVLERALAKDPGNRHSSCGEFVRDLRRSLLGPRNSIRDWEVAPQPPGR